LADPIAGLRSPFGALITVYIDRPGPGGMAALLTDLLKPVREEAELLGGIVRKSVRADADRIHDLADELETDIAPAYAVFASDADRIFLLEPLTHSAPSSASLGPRPYLRPLRAAPRPLRVGVIVGDRVLTRVFVGSNGLVEELTVLTAEIGKPNYGGFGGYDERNVRSHADEETTRMWKEAGTRLLERHLDRPLDYLVVGGHEETFEDIGRTLHPYLARLHRATFVANPHTLTPAALRSEVADLSVEVRRQRQAALAEHLGDTARGRGLAVIGLSKSLQACNAQAVDTLVVAGSFTRPGVICNQCGFLARSGDTCPVCSAPMFPVDDVVAAAMDATVATGGTIDQIEVASQLDAEGVGAFTRFRVPGLSPAQASG
jgi:peptide chain release factor subunit 1